MDKKNESYAYTQSTLHRFSIGCSLFLIVGTDFCGFHSSQLNSCGLSVFLQQTIVRNLSFFASVLARKQFRKCLTHFHVIFM